MSEKYIELHLHSHGKSTSSSESACSDYRSCVLFLLSPLSDHDGLLSVQSSIDARLDTVEGDIGTLESASLLLTVSPLELVQSEDMYMAVKDGLRALNKVDMDKLIASVYVSLPHKFNY